MTGTSRIVREASASAWSQPVASSLTVLVVAAMIVAVMLTTGRTVAAEGAVLRSIDSAGTRTITFQAEEGAGLRGDVIDRVAQIEGIEWAGAFTAATDATNTLIPGGQYVPVRGVISRDFRWLGAPPTTAVGNGAYATRQAQELLGLRGIAGSVTLTTGAEYPIVGEFRLPEAVASLEPLVSVPGEAGDEEISQLVVVAQRPELIAPVGAAVSSVLGADEPSKVSQRTSANLAQLREVVADQLSSFSRGLVLVLLAVTGVLVAALLYGLVMMRRKDFGRRRALGASRGFIISLLLTQTALLASTGVTAGALGSTIYLTLSGAPLPGGDFTAALAILSVLTAVIAAIAPGAVASRRDPMRELRVP